MTGIFTNNPSLKASTDMGVKLPFFMFYIQNYVTTGITLRIKLKRPLNAQSLCIFSYFYFFNGTIGTEYNDYKLT